VDDAEADVDEAERDVTRPTDSPITAHINAAATIHPLLLSDSSRRAHDRRGAGFETGGVSGRIVGS
jgi:hypothetical protein